MNQIEFAFEMMHHIHVLRLSNLKRVILDTQLGQFDFQSFNELYANDGQFEKLIIDAVDINPIKELDLLFLQKSKILYGKHSTLSKLERREELLAIDVISELYIDKLEKSISSIQSSILKKSPLITDSQFKTYQDYTKKLRSELNKSAVIKVEERDLMYSVQEEADSYKEILKQVQVGMLVLNKDGEHVEFITDSFQKLDGATMKVADGRKYLITIEKLIAYFEPSIFEVIDKSTTQFKTEIEFDFGQGETCFYNFILQPYRGVRDASSKVIILAIDATEQVDAKRQLIRSENQFRNLVQYSQFAKSIISRDDFKIVLFNDTMLEKFLKKGLKSIVGENFFEVFPELKYHKLRDELKHVFETGETYVVTERGLSIRDKNTLKNYFFDYQLYPLKESNGEITEVMLSLNDVTSSVESKSLTREIAESLQLATAGARICTFDLDLPSRRMVYTERLNEILGFAKGSRMSYEDILDRVYPDDKQSVLEINLNFESKNTEPIDFEIRVLNTSGKIIWVRVQGRVLLNEATQPWRFVGIVMDITNSKLAEMAVIRSEGKFRTLAEAMPQFIWTCDKHGRFDYISQSFFDFIGVNGTVFDSNSWFERIHKNDQNKYYWKWKESILNETRFDCEVRFLKHDGEYRWYLCIGIPQLDVDGKLGMWIGSCTDIHQSKMSIDHLELMVQKRTQEVMDINEQLTKTNIELGQFAYVASHDLQEPLRKIQTFAGRILDTEFNNLSEKGKDYFMRMQGASNRMKQLIVDLLAFTRVNVGEGDFEKTDINLILENIKEDLSEKILQKDVQIIYDKLPFIHAISFQIEQLLSNLIANSIKFSVYGRIPEIIINAGRTEQPNVDIKLPNNNFGYYFITVTDNGIGFDMSYKDRIFQVFQRLHTRIEYEGTGIGLSICKKIVDNHGGILDVESHLGKGTTFKIYIPIHK